MIHTAVATRDRLKTVSLYPHGHVIHLDRRHRFMNKAKVHVTERLASLEDEVNTLSDLHIQMSIALERVRGELARARAGDVGQLASRPLIDRSRFAVLWQGRICKLGQTLLFRLFEKLVRRHDHYFSIDQLLQDVWGGQRRSPDTLRSTVRLLRRRLRRARMVTLAKRIRASGKSYSLVLEE